MYSGIGHICCECTPQYFLRIYSPPRRTSNVPQSQRAREQPVSGVSARDGHLLPRCCWRVDSATAQ